MATLEEYMAQASNAYKPAQNAVQSQLDALNSQLATGEEKLNKQYALQEDTLNRQRNQAAEASSLSAAGSGGSFGGQGNIARRKYYEQSFVPALTTLQTNRSNDLDTLRQNIENQRANYNAQLANLESQANQQALQKYWADVEQEKQRQWEEAQAEKSRQAQLAAARASNAWSYIGNGGGNGSGQSQQLKNWDFGGGYSLQQGSDGKATYYYNGRPISAGRFVSGTGANGANWDMWNDVWNNGVSTEGVGSDTVAAFNYKSPNDARYGYLF